MSPTLWGVRCYLNLRIGEWRPMASMRMGGVLTWAQSSRRSKLERTDLNTGSGSDLYAAMHRGLGRAPGDPLQVRLLPVSRLCLPCVLSPWVCAAPSSFTFNGSGNSGFGTQQALAEPVGGCASQRRRRAWPRRAQGSSPDALGVGVGAATQAEGQARSASL